MISQEQPPEPSYDVLVLGGVGVDTIVRVADLAIPGGDSVGVPPVRDYVAHSGNGVALGFHALGLRTKFADFLGEDAAGALVLARYQETGLDFSHLPAPDGTPRAVNLVDDQGRRFSFYDARHPADLMLPRDFYLPFLQRARHVHVAASRGFGALLEARKLGITSSTDIHAWDGADPYWLPMLRETDVVFMSAANAGERIDEIMRGILTLGRARLVVATAAEAGCRVLSREDQQILVFPSVAPERPVVDSNGAGDAFSTAFLSRWLAGAPLVECALAGAVSGAFACGVPGTHEELIGDEELALAAERAAKTDPQVWISGS